MRKYDFLSGFEIAFDYYGIPYREIGIDGKTYYEGTEEFSKERFLATFCHGKRVYDIHVNSAEMDYSELTDAAMWLFNEGYCEGMEFADVRDEIDGFNEFVDIDEECPYVFFVIDENTEEWGTYEDEEEDEED